MSTAVEDPARARIITDAPFYRAVAVALRFDPDEPQSVRIVFPAGLSPDGTENEWRLTRNLLETGLRSPAGTGDVRIWPCGRVQVVVEFHSPEGVAVVQFDSSALRRFLRHTYAVAAPVSRRPSGTHARG
ncbi:SsgA family sporulation/cell division regulator [Streptomyces sp. NPDC051219]|uniref:SsgA family sporulation/cell division regulator n=1 Tax=Streptomyces sp. NPDC051219 TaxID=3155283 RepID=UPI0034478844